MALRDDSHDVERLFTVLVEELAAAGSGRLRQSLQVSEIYLHIVPYRTHRDRLAIDVNADYEMALLRLLAGEGGYAAIQPEEARRTLADEAAAPNPDTGLVREYAAAPVVLDQGAVKRILARESGFGPAPEADSPREDVKSDDQPEGPPRPSAPVFALEPDQTVPDVIPRATPLRAPADPVRGASACKACGRTLPLHRVVTYCPFCGEQAGTRHCTQCGETIEAGWRYCVACGSTPAR